MSVFKCPVCKRMHVANRYDTDYVCDNSLSQKKKDQDQPRDDLLTRNNFNLNQFDTKVDAYKDYTITEIPFHPSDKNRYLGGENIKNY